MLPTGPEKLKVPLAVFNVRLLATARVLSKLMLPPLLEMVEAPETDTGVRNTIGALTEFRFTPTFAEPPGASTVIEWKVDGDDTKLTLPVACAFRFKGPVTFWLCAAVMPLTSIDPAPWVLRFKPPEVLMSESSAPVMVI